MRTAFQIAAKSTLCCIMASMIYSVASKPLPHAPSYSKNERAALTKLVKRVTKKH